MSYPMEIKSTNTIIVTAGYGADSRTVELEVGKRYVVEPLNKLTMKNRGRVVELLGFTDSFMPDGAIIRYIDTNRRGRVRPSYLSPPSETKG